MGNRTTETDTANSLEFTGTFNNLNQLTQSVQSVGTGSTTNYGYDAKGNLTSSLQVAQTSGPTYT